MPNHFLLPVGCWHRAIPIGLLAGILLGLVYNPPAAAAGRIAKTSASLDANGYVLATPKAHGSSKETLGWLQSIRLLPHKVRMTAKLDTGAKSSVIHAVGIEAFKKNAQHWVRFTVPVEKKTGMVEMKFELPVQSHSRIKQHHSERLDERYVVLLDFCIAGQVYSANFSLDNREKFNYPVLLGREFLQDYFVVDPAKTFIKKYNCTPKQARG